MTINNLSREMIQFLSQALGGLQPKTAPVEVRKEPWKSIVFETCNSADVKDTKERVKAFRQAVEKRGGDYEQILQQLHAIDPAKPAPKARKTEWTSDELIDAEFPEQNWTVRNFILEGGVTELSAKPKMGKTWLAIQVAAAVASGVSMFRDEEFPVKQGKVVYFALEDNTKRISSRLKLQQVSRGLPLIFRQTIPSLDLEGLDELKKTIETEKPVLIVIDTFTPAHSREIDENKAEDVSRIFLPLRILADEKKVSFLVNHHHKKGAQGDPRDDSRGSSAIGAAVDIVAGMYKENGSKILRLMGNDIDDLDYVISFNERIPYNWTIIGKAQEVAKTRAEEELLEKLEEMGKATASELARELGKSRQTVNSVLRRLLPEKVNREKMATGRGFCSHIYTPIIKK